MAPSERERIRLYEARSGSWGRGAIVPRPGLERRTSSSAPTRRAARRASPRRRGEDLGLDLLQDRAGIHALVEEHDRDAVISSPSVSPVDRRRSSQRRSSNGCTFRQPRRVSRRKAGRRIWRTPRRRCRQPRAPVVQPAARPRGVARLQHAQPWLSAATFTGGATGARPRRPDDRLGHHATTSCPAATRASERWHGELWRAHEDQAQSPGGFAVRRLGSGLALQGDSRTALLCCPSSVPTVLPV